MQLSSLLWSIAYAAPSLIVYLIAFIMGTGVPKKHKPAGLLAMLGGMTAGLVAIGGVIVRELFLAKIQAGDNREENLMLMRGTGICSQVFEAVGMGMIVFAVFAGRKQTARADERDFDDHPRRDERDDEPTEPSSHPHS